GVAATEFFFDFEIGRLPEAGEILRNLDGTACRGQEMQHNRNLSVDEAGRVFAAEHFLQPHSQDREIRRLVFQAKVRSAWDRHMGRSPPFKLALLLPGKERVQWLGKIESCHAVERRQSCN